MSTKPLLQQWVTTAIGVTYGTVGRIGLRGCYCSKENSLPREFYRYAHPSALSSQRLESLKATQIELSLVDIIATQASMFRKPMPARSTTRHAPGRDSA